MKDLSRFKPILYTLFLLIAAFIVWKYRQNDETIKWQGETMGTYYRLKFVPNEIEIHQRQIDSILQVINQDFSTYIDESSLSQLNQKGELHAPSKHFSQLLKVTNSVFNLTNGLFDPTVMPLVEAWGFGPNRKVTMDSLQLDSLIQFIGFQKVQWDTKKIQLHKGAKLDFSAIAKGYAVDEIADFLEKNGITNYLIEIGGELRCGGKNKSNAWVIGIEKPQEGLEREAMIKIKLHNMAIATSGNYRNYHKIGDKLIVHTINPKTGLTQESNLISVSILTESCGKADALATGIMVMGLEEGWNLVQNLKDTEGYFVYANEQGELLAKYTDGFKAMIHQ